MASIIKRKSKYSVIYSYDDENGEKRQKWETWGTLAEAKKRKAEIEYKQSTHTFVRPSIKTISDLMYDFVEHCTVLPSGRYPPLTQKRG